MRKIPPRRSEDVGQVNPSISNNGDNVRYSLGIRIGTYMRIEAVST